MALGTYYPKWWEKVNPIHPRQYFYINDIVLDHNLSIDDIIFCLCAFHRDNGQDDKARLVKRILKPGWYIDLPPILKVIEVLGLPYIILLLSVLDRSNQQRSQNK